MDDEIDIEKQVPAGTLTGVSFNVLTETDAVSTFWSLLA